MDIWVVHTKSLAHQQVSLTYREWDSPRGCELLSAYSVSYSKITYIWMVAGEVTGVGAKVLPCRQELPAPMQMLSVAVHIYNPTTPEVWASTSGS